MGDIRITRRVSIPESEIEVSFARSGGPGGQHVNTSSTKAELRFDVDASQALTDRDKERVREHLASRLTKDGVLVLQASEHRSQAANRRAVVGRLENLLGEALQPRKARRPTRPTRAAKERRLESKRRRAEKKRLRRSPEPPV
jgi:ribosome-associated protein